jgi:epoxyqueuosine reductase
MPEGSHVDGQWLVQQLRGWAREAGFSQIGVSAIDLAQAEPGLLANRALQWS